MTPNRYRIGFYLLLVVALAQLAFVARLIYDRAWLSIQITFAAEQTETFDQMRDEALQSSPEKAVEYLQYAVKYYPSGTKQVEGSRLDRIVERARQGAVRDILADLRVKTGKDLGNDPQRWIDEFKKREK